MSSMQALHLIVELGAIALKAHNRERTLVNCPLRH